MTTAYATAPFNISYGARTPYITTAEYDNAPTAMDTTNLVSGGSVSNLIALQETINRASSWVDQFTCGAWGTLCATVETENTRSWGSYRNTLIIHPKYWPTVEVRSFQFSSIPGGLASTTGASVTPSSSITVYPQQFEVTLTAATTFNTTGTTGFGGWGSSYGIARRTEYDCLYTYVAGWPNTTLSASVAAGASSVAPTSVIGIYPGSLMTVYDLPNDEPCTVASTYIPGSAVVPLTSPLQFNHGSSATITNMPPAIKQAAILATTAFIKQRGSGALIVTDIAAPITTAESGTGAQQSGSDWAQAQRLLMPFRQQYVGN